MFLEIGGRLTQTPHLLGRSEMREKSIDPIILAAHLMQPHIARISSLPFEYLVRYCTPLQQAGGGFATHAAGRRCTGSTGS